MIKIEVFAICYNEEKMLPYFLRYYSQFGDITVYDNMSTDNSIEIMKSHRVNVIPYDTNNQIRDDVYIDIKNNCYKKSDSDWVIVCDIDEFVYHKDLLSIIEKSKSTIIRPTGYEMFSESFPTTDKMIFEEIKTGILYPNSSKMCLFKPQEIEINFLPGCHNAKPRGNVVIDENTNIKLLHYKHLSRDYVIKRYKIYEKRLSNINKQRNWGKHYYQKEAEINAYFDKNMKASINVVN